MSYEEWLKKLVELERNTIRKDILEELRNEKVNPNFNSLLEPKLEELLKKKFSKAVNRVRNDLTSIFNDENYLDMVLVNFRKEIEYLLDLVKLPQISNDKKVLLTYKIVEGTREIYDKLIKEARIIDTTGILEMTIKNNRIKWSE